MQASTGLGTDACLVWLVKSTLVAILFSTQEALALEASSTSGHSARVVMEGCRDLLLV